MAGEPKKKNKGGRPSKFNKVINNNIELIKKYYRFGLTDKQVADLLGITEQTLNNYKKNEEFFESLKKEKLIADIEVIASLYKRAIGYDYDEVYQEGYPTVDKNGKEIFKIKSVKKTKKQIAPDATSIIYWLRNRQGWRDKLASDVEQDIQSIPEFETMTDEQLQRIINAE